MKNPKLILSVLIACAWPVVAQKASVEPERAVEAVKERIAAIRESILENRNKLRTYTWLETTEVSIKDELKTRRQAECHYAPNGTVQKTPVGTPAEAAKPRGLKGKLAAGKIEEMHDYVERLGSYLSVHKHASQPLGIHGR